jgi:hypothetical protein
MKIVEEECDESLYWLELVRDARLVTPELLRPLYEEGRAILALAVASVKTARAGLLVVDRTRSKLPSKALPKGANCQLSTVNCQSEEVRLAHSRP